LKKLKTIHESHEAARKKSLVRVISCAFVDRFLLHEDGLPFFSGLLYEMSDRKNAFEMCLNGMSELYTGQLPGFA